MNKTYSFMYKETSRRYDHKYFDVKITEYDKGLGQKEYKATVYYIEGGEGNEYPNFAKAAKKLREALPDFREDRLTTLEFDNCTEAISIGEFPFNTFDNLRVFKTNGKGSVHEDTFYLSALSSPVLERAEIDSQILHRYSDEVELNVRSKALKEIICDGYPIPVKQLTGDASPYCAVRGISHLIKEGIPLTEQNMCIITNYAEDVGITPSMQIDFHNYDELGMLPLLNDAYLPNFRRNTMFDNFGMARYQLKTAFSEKFNDRYPKKLNPFIAVMREGLYSAEEIAEKFNFKQFSQGNIPMFNRMSMMMVLDKNEYKDAMNNNNSDLIAKLCNSGHARSKDSMELRKDPDVEKRFYDAARFLIKHPKINAELAIEMTDAVHKSRAIHITPEMSTAEVRSLIINYQGIDEMKNIEAEYSDFDFNEAVFDLKFCDVELGNLHAGIMKPGDTRMAILGQATDCCQHLGSAGESAMMYGLVYEHAGFWIIEDKNKHKILAQAEIWEKDPNTLIFDNIEFADDRDVSQFSELIGLWAEKSQYENIYMGTGYNELADEMGDKVKTIEGCRPPVNHTVRKIVGDSIYTDAASKQAVIKKDNAVEPFFSKNHDGRMFSKVTDAEGQEVHRASSLEELRELFGYSVTLKRYDDILKQIKSDDSVSVADIIVKIYDDEIRNIPEIEKVISVVEPGERTLAVGYQEKMAIRLFKTDCVSLKWREDLDSMPYDEFKRKCTQIILLYYNQSQRSHGRGVVPVKVVEAINETLSNYDGNYDNLRSASPKGILDEALKTHPSCRKGVRSGTAAMIPLDQIISSPEDDSGVVLHENSTMQLNVSNLICRDAENYFNENGYTDYIKDNWEKLAVNGCGEKKDVISAADNVLRCTYVDNIDKKEVALYHLAYYLETFKEITGSEVPQAFVPDSTEPRNFYKIYGNYDDRPVEMYAESLLNNYLDDLKKNEGAMLPIQITIDKKGDDPLTLGQPINVKCSVITRSGGELSHSIEYRLGTDPGIIKEEIVAWADSMIPNHVVDAAARNYPDASDDQRQKFCASISAMKKEILNGFDKNGRIREQLEIRRQEAIRQAEEKKAIPEVKEPEPVQERVYLDKPVQMSIFDFQDVDKEISEMEDITLDELDTGLGDLLKALGVEDGDLIGECLRISGETEETSAYIPVKGITDEEFLTEISEKEMNSADPYVREFANQVLNNRNAISEMNEIY